MIIIALVSYSSFTTREVTSEAERKAQLDFDNDVRSLNVFLGSCIEHQGREALIQFGKQGGRIFLPDRYYTNGSINTSYLYYRGEVLLQDSWEDDISSGVNEYIISCLEGEEIRIYNLDIDSENPLTKTTFSRDRVILDISWPLSLSRESFSHTSGTFSVAYPIDLMKTYDDVSAIISMEVLDPDFLNILYLVQLATNIFFWTDNDTILYTLTYNRSVLDNKPYQFTFANKMNHSLDGP